MPLRLYISSILVDRKQQRIKRVGAHVILMRVCQLPEVIQRNPVVGVHRQCLLEFLSSSSIVTLVELEIALDGQSVIEISLLLDEIIEVLRKLRIRRPGQKADPHLIIIFPKLRRHFRDGSGILNRHPWRKKQQRLHQQQRYQKCIHTRTGLT